MQRFDRVLDANANRAREAMRVLEDAARFGLDDPAASAQLKRMRHGIQEALAKLPRGRLAGTRDVEGDVGRTISTPGEARRSGWGDVVAAAGSRLTEALRSIEELLKIEAIEAAQAVEAFRYEAYELAPRLERAIRAGERRQWRLCLLLSVDRCRHPWEHTLTEAIGGGVDCVQVREKSMADRSLLEHTRRVISLARPHGVAVVVNDRVDVALAARADGVHLGTGDLPVRAARAFAGKALLIGASTHSLEEADAVVSEGADLLGVGCMFASGTKPGLEPAGPELLRELRRRHPAMPHLAIGGIGPENLARLVEAGARGVAVSSALLDADDPRAVAASMVDELERGEPRDRARAEAAAS